MSGPARPLADALRDAPEAARLLARVEATQRASRCIAPVCRSLAAGFDPVAPGRCELRETVLWLTASSTAQSAKLRQATPRMLAALGSEGVQVYEIRVRVQPGMSGYPEQGTGAAPDASWLRTSPGAAAAVDRFAQTVQEDGLRRALERLAATLLKRSR